MFKRDGLWRPGMVPFALEMLSRQLPDIQVVASRLFPVATHAQIDELYMELREKPWYDDRVLSLVDTPIMPMVLRGEEAAVRVKEVVGPTAPEKCNRNQIRYYSMQRFDHSQQLEMHVFNLCHTSGTAEAAAREIPIFFAPEEIMPMPAAA